MESSMRVAVVQMEIEDGQPQRNLERATRWIMKSDADLVVLPELWTSGYCHKKWANIARNSTPQILRAVADLCRAEKKWVAGSIISACDRKLLANRFILMNPSGVLAGYYDKVHLFKPLQEHIYLQPGTRLPVFSIKGFRVSPAICFDLRFPELFRTPIRSKTDLYVVASEWPHPRCEALTTLARARAIENGAYLALANRVGGSSSTLRFCGGSRIVDPLGAETQVRTRQGVIALSVERSLIQKARRFIQ
jgi:omega-amidase